MHGRHRQIPGRFSRWALAAALTLVATTTRADRIVFKGGGELKGVIVPDPQGREGFVGILTDRSSTPLPMKQEQIGRVIAEAGPLREYLGRREKAGDSAQAHYDVGLWCESAKLSGPADIEFRRAAELDPEFGPARRKLGHVERGGKWLTPDEDKEAQGLVKYK